MYIVFFLLVGPTSSHGAGALVRGKLLVNFGQLSYLSLSTGKYGSSEKQLVLLL